MTVPDWLPGTIVAVAERAGGTIIRPGGALVAVVTARVPGEFDVVLELDGGTATMQLWGLERRYALVHDALARGAVVRGAAHAAVHAAAHAAAHDAPPDADAAARTLVADWVAALDGSARLAVYHEGGVARCWTLLVAGAPWHPTAPPSRLVRWLRRWRRVVHTNAYLDAATSADILGRLRTRGTDGAPVPATADARAA